MAYYWSVYLTLQACNFLSCKNSEYAQSVHIKRYKNVKGNGVIEMQIEVNIESENGSCTIKKVEL